MYYTYVLQSQVDQEYYTGSTNNLKRRCAQHNDGLVYSTKHRRPLELVYYEACLSERDAQKRERFLKSGRGKWFLKRRLDTYLQNI